MTQIVVTLGRKGGITKTTVTVTLAAALALLGFKVLILESDGQGNATEAVGLEKRDDFYALIAQDAEFADLIRPVPVEFVGKPTHLHILSARNLQYKVEGDEATPGKMVERFAELRGVYDFVIGDTSPGATQVHFGWYYASDYAILPSTCEWLSVKSLEDTMGFIHDADARGRDVGYPAAKILGILPNRYSRGVNNSQYNLGWLCAKYEQYPVYERMRELSAWETALRSSRSIYGLKPGVDRRLQDSLRAARKEFDPVVKSVAALATKAEGAA